MFRMAPSLFRTSENKIRLGLEFLLETVKLEKSTLVQLPTLLMFSMKEKVILRYQVFQLIKSKKLMKKDPTFYDMMCLTEHLFLEKDHDEVQCMLASRVSNISTRRDRLASYNTIAYSVL
ncbi:hypothetical protein H5410_064482 [Solanum commersonii]|uniref:Uncharacterized protein n=1 Tax=Solanum commersonii TaxID=4109 RepID=A0A9J5VZ81_SOLCO|nr:hypothetical protein H5410_064482 [Solanum commersonii]